MLSSVQEGRQRDAGARLRVYRGCCFKCLGSFLWIESARVLSLLLITTDEKLSIAASAIALIELTVSNKLVSVQISGFDETSFSPEVEAEGRELHMQSEVNVAEVTVFYCDGALQVPVGRALDFISNSSLASIAMSSAIVRCDTSL